MCVGCVGVGVCMCGGVGVCVCGGGGGGVCLLYALAVYISFSVVSKKASQ